MLDLGKLACTHSGPWPVNRGVCPKCYEDLRDEVARLRGQLDSCNASAAETERQLAALVKAGEQYGCNSQGWLEAKRKAGL